MRARLFGLLALVVTTLAAVPASGGYAQLADSLYFPDQINKIHLGDYEQAVDTSGNAVNVITAGTILRGVANITQFTDALGGNTHSPSGFEVNVIFEGQVIDIATSGSNSYFKLAPVNSTSLGGTNDLGGNNMLVAYATPSGTYTSAASASSFSSAMSDITGASGAQEWLAFGSTGNTWGSDWFWGASGPANPADAGNVLTTFDASLRLLPGGNSGVQLVADVNQTPPVGLESAFGIPSGTLKTILNELGVNGSVTANQDSNNGVFPLSSSDPGRLDPVPEPGTLAALIGMACLGFMGIVRRRAAS